MNDEIQYTDKFDILTYPLGTNSVAVMSPDCIYASTMKFKGIQLRSNRLKA
jgi:hypothetical protein